MLTFARKVQKGLHKNYRTDFSNFFIQVRMKYVLVLVLVLVIPGRTTYSPHSKASGVRASYGGLIRVLYYYHTIKTIAN